MIEKHELDMKTYGKSKNLTFMSLESQKEKRNHSTENLSEKQNGWKFLNLTKDANLDLRRTANAKKDKLKEIHTQSHYGLASMS